MCTSGISYTSDYATGSIGIYKSLGAKYRKLFYSGDTDGAVPTYGSLAWIKSMNYKTVTPWSAYMVNGQVGGYFVNMKNSLLLLFMVLDIWFHKTRDQKLTI